MSRQLRLVDPLPAEPRPAEPRSRAPRARPASRPARARTARRAVRLVDWQLDPRARRVGQRGVAAARAALDQARGDGPDLSKAS